MADTVSAARRSEIMSRVRGRDTKPELIVRSMLHRMGYRFTIHGPKNKSLPGRPDIVLPKYRTVVFVHGCFWHAHANCSDHRIPKSRIEFWKSKIEGNRARDERNEAMLCELGWNVIVVWTCLLKSASKRTRLQAQLLHSLNSSVQWLRTE